MSAERNQSEASTRREFLEKLSITAATTLAVSSVLSTAGCSSLQGEPAEPSATLPIKADSTILFQGDSITDAGRNRRSQAKANDAGALGRGYAFLAACQLLAENADVQLQIYNRGISGHKVFQLADRWDKDCLDLKPDIVSILIGVNDIWHGLNGKYDGTVETYAKDYRALVARTKAALPEVELVICEPFVLRCGAVNDSWFPEFDQYRAAARDIATEAEALFVPFQSMFDIAVEHAPPSHWAGDGVHPSMAGSYLMAQAWLKTVAEA
jgi:lysophospholipase L1-like esterase